MPPIPLEFFDNYPEFDEPGDWAVNGINLIAEVVAEACGAERGPYGYDDMLTTNSGAPSFENDLFEMHAFCFCDGEVDGHEYGCPPNFTYKPRNLSFVWFKHTGQCLLSNHPALSGIEWQRIVADCCDSAAGDGTRVGHSHDPLCRYPFPKSIPPEECHDCLVIKDARADERERNDAGASCFLVGSADMRWARIILKTAMGSQLKDAVSFLGNVAERVLEGEVTLEDVEDEVADRSAKESRRQSLMYYTVDYYI